MTLSVCPDRQRWQAHLRGTLPAPEQTQLVAHLDGCTACQRLLETLAAGGEADLRLARQLAEEPGLRELIRKVARQLPGEATATHAAAEGEGEGEGEVPLDFLAPPRDPAHLGRLAHY